ncbi:MAG: hypothetical protein Q9174_002306 [Haloplaca sp. 1 TL-2023]
MPVLRMNAYFPDTTTQMIETIWPLSVMSCGRDTSTDSKNQNLIGLRFFVQEVLKRSKTSYSTLQVALYYLVLVQGCLPRHDFTMEQREDTQGCRAMQCGRRMFLASLILASKYLQDRNFSARAWSKISGLKASEINTNEVAFLRAVNWKLHIPEPIFQRWTDIVLKFSPCGSSLTSPRSSPCAINKWKAVIPRLTPDLDNLYFGHAELANGPWKSKKHLQSPEPMRSTSNEPTPTPCNPIPRTMEPKTCALRTDKNIEPALLRMGPLPTPAWTPNTRLSTNTFSTPAVGAEGICPRRSSMSLAMGQARKAAMDRTLLDKMAWCPSVSPVRPIHPPTSARRSSLARSTSSLSSPESMVSDTSSRSSRSSSISSVASSTCALPLSKPGGLAAQATLRCANMQSSGMKENFPIAMNLILQPSTKYGSECDMVLPEQGMYASPVEATRHECGKQILENEQCTPAAHQAATALQHLALNGQYGPPHLISRPPKSRKRERPPSVDLSSQDFCVQDAVRDIIAPRGVDDLAVGGRSNEDDSTVLPDGNVADSLPLLKPGTVSNFDCRLKPLLGKGPPRKRWCGDGGAQQELDSLKRLIAAEIVDQSGPGMWNELI